MLSRRHLRVKVLQALYAFFTGEDFEISKGEKELFKSIDKVMELYLSKLNFLTELKNVADKQIEDNKQKLLPSAEDLNPNLRFIENKALIGLCKNKQLAYLCSSRKISWSNEKELVRKIFFQIRDGEEYQEYMSKPTTSFKEDVDFLVIIFCNYVAEHDLLESIYEEQSIYWQDDFHLVNTHVIKTLKSVPEINAEELPLLELYKDAEDDKKFVSDLYRRAIVNQKEYGEQIKSKVKNWEMERIAIMDIIIMKMAICELLNFPTIPVKVTLNEYIELSKEYSTEKSKIFINGVLDKLIAEFKANHKITKVGRGLME